jgi:hypothetical protein
MPDGGENWLPMTYAQLAAARGIKRSSAERLARIHKWPRVTGNGGAVIVSVPPEMASPDPSPGSRGRIRQPDPPLRAWGRIPTPDIRGAIEAAVAPLREQLEHERKRADSAEQQVVALRSELVEVRIAERVAAERAKMLDQRPARRGWWLWRRL